MAGTRTEITAALRLHGPPDRLERRLHGLGQLHAAKDHVRVLEPVPREDAYDRAFRSSAFPDELQEAGYACGGGRLAEDALLVGEQLLGGEYLRVRDALDEAPRLARRR